MSVFIPVDHTIPRNIEGASFITMNVTPTSPVCLYEFEAALNVSHTAASETIAAMWTAFG